MKKEEVKEVITTIEGVEYSIQEEYAPIVFESFRESVCHPEELYEEKLRFLKKEGQFFLHCTGGPASSCGDGTRPGWQVKPLSFVEAVTWSVGTGFRLRDIVREFEALGVG